MKTFLLLFYLLIFSTTLSAQNSWELPTKIADSLEAKAQFEQALTHRQKAIEAAKSHSDSTQKIMEALEMVTLAEKGFFQSRGPNPAAYTLKQDAVDSLITAGAGPLRLRNIYRRLAENAFDFMYKPKDAEYYLKQTLSYAEKAPVNDTIFLLEVMEFTAFVKIILHKYQEAIEISNNALKLFDQLQEEANSDLELKAKFYSNLALVYGVQFLNLPQKEYQYTIETEKILASMENPNIEQFVLTYRKLSMLEQDFRNYQKAEGYLQKAMRLYEEHKEDLRSDTRIGNKLALSLYRAFIQFLSETNNEKALLGTYNKVQLLAKNNKLDEVEKGLYKGILNDITTHYLYVSLNLDTAKNFIDKASAIQLDSRKAPYSLDSYNQQTKINTITYSYCKKDYQKALALITDAEKTRGFHNDKLLLELKAKSLLAQNLPQQSNDAINEILIEISDSNTEFDFPETSTHLFAPGFIILDSEMLVRLAEAVEAFYGTSTIESESLYWIALAQFENNLYNTPLNKNLKNTFDKIVSGLLNAALYRDFTAVETNRLLSFMEKASSQDFINKFLLKREIAGNTELFKLVEEEQYLRSHITLLKKQYQESENDSLKQALFEKQLSLKEIEDQLSSRLNNSDLFNLPTINTQAFAGKNIIKFVSANNQLFKLRLYNGSLFTEKIADYPMLKGQIADFLKKLSNLETPSADLKLEGEKLYHQLFKNEFETQAHTIIIPDDILFYLPFELLTLNNAYLLQNYIISYAPSLYFLNPNTLNESALGNGKAVFFAPEYTGNIPESQLAIRGATYSLPGAEEEINAITKFVSGKTYVGEKASKSNFKALDTDVSILHLAMHANLNDQDPELSSLLFSSTEQDYEMYISELYGLYFNADLAVLSACNTGIGGFENGGDLISMHHAFKTAGIPATIASLWNAPDLSTKEIMVDFYQNLQAGKDKATALQQAKLNYLAKQTNETLQHPFYWAGFVLSGNYMPIALQETAFWQQYPILVSLGFLLLILLVYFFIWKKSKLKARKIS